MPTGTTSYRCGSSAFATATAVTRDTSCSAERPPKRSMTRSLRSGSVTRAPYFYEPVTWRIARIPSPMMNRPPSPYASSIQPRAFQTYL